MNQPVWMFRRVFPPSIHRYCYPGHIESLIRSGFRYLPFLFLRECGLPSIDKKLGNLSTHYIKSVSSLALLTTKRRRGTMDLHFATLTEPNNIKTNMSCSMLFQIQFRISTATRESTPKSEKQLSPETLPSRDCKIRSRRHEKATTNTLTISPSPSAFFNSALRHSSFPVAPGLLMPLSPSPPHSRVKCPNRGSRCQCSFSAPLRYRLSPVVRSTIWPGIGRPATMASRNI